VQVQTWHIHKQNVCSFFNITSHQNRLLLFVKHLAMRILSRKCLSVTSLSNKTAEIMAIPTEATHQLQQHNTAARIQYCL
jgi:hypothetical protein